MSLSQDPRLLLQRRTKIVVTLGPASSQAESIERLIEAGVNVFRLNMSHGEVGDHAEVAQRIRSVRSRMAGAGAHVAILVDLCGPKIRVGRFQNGGIDLQDGADVVVTTREQLGEPGLIRSQYQGVVDDVESGQRILLDDGRLELKVDHVDGQDVHCKVVHGGRLTDRKGMNLPDSRMSVAAITDADREAVAFAVEQEVDFVALSFVRSAADIDELRGLLPAEDAPWIVAKIERPEALEDAEAIVAKTDAIMVARGDLGIELPFEAVPAAQDKLVVLARQNNTPVIIATQMLDSMIRHARPTRAEVADIAHAVNSGADALMLSGETAVGQFPFESVAVMDRVIRRTEAYMWSDSAFLSLADHVAEQRPMPLEDAFGQAVAQLSRDLGVRTILVLSRSGTSGLMISASRPAAPVLAASSRDRTCRLLSLCWGVVPVLVEEQQLAHGVTLLRSLVAKLNLAREDHYGLIVRGFLTDVHQTQPTLSVVRV